MNSSLQRFRFAARHMAALFLLIVTSAGASGQNTASTDPDSNKTRSILDLQINHASISVADINAEAKWYIHTLGFSFRPGEKIDQINPKMQGCRLVISGFQLDLIQYAGSERPKAASPIFAQQGYFHLDFTVADTEAAFSFLEAIGVKATANRDTQNRIRSIVLEDPEGNEIELSSR